MGERNLVRFLKTEREKNEKKIPIKTYTRHGLSDDGSDARRAQNRSARRNNTGPNTVVRISKRSSIIIILTFNPVVGPRNNSDNPPPTIEIYAHDKNKPHRNRLKSESVSQRLCRQTVKGPSSITNNSDNSNRNNDLTSMVLYSSVPSKNGLARVTPKRRCWLTLDERQTRLFEVTLAGLFLSGIECTT